LNQAISEVKLPAIVSSGMVLQRNATVKLWGWAAANEKITIQVSWQTGTNKVVADEQGKWQLALSTTDSKAPQTISIKSKESDIRLDNVLFGEVWLCSGQSNMQQPLKGYMGQPTFEGPMAIAKANNPHLRLFTVNRKGSKTPLQDVNEFVGWQSATPASVADFSAVAYFFGQQLQEILDVPVGLIHTSWGGSAVEAWMSDEAISPFQTVNLDEVDLSQRTNLIPTALFNAMINPLTSYAIKGVLWYQGESNRLEPEKYKDFLPAMVKDWRSRWGLGDFPFYYVQIAPFMYGNDNEVFQSAENSAFIREAQSQCLELIANSGMAVTMDVGDDHCIHPPKKKEVADRLLFNALYHTYGYKNVDYSGPVFSNQKADNGGLLLEFDHAEMGIFAYGELEGFEIAGDDKVFHPAKATIVKGKQVFVVSDSVPQPVAVRYAWRNWVNGTLFDSGLLPASSFRTDDWEDATRAE
jgi:sialate O-acetylesterase